MILCFSEMENFLKLMNSAIKSFAFSIKGDDKRAVLEKDAGFHTIRKLFGHFFFIVSIGFSMESRRKTVLISTLVIGMGTLLSRVLGMFRDAATAAVLGMSGGIMDSFVLAFRLPDVTRRMFGEGSLSVSFIPIFARLWQEDRKKAWAFASSILFNFFVILTILVLLGEGICFLGIVLFPNYSRVQLVCGMSAMMLPYLILICLAAIIAASLQMFGKFFVPSLIPTILNIFWLFGILILAPALSSDLQTRCFILIGCILCAGFVQLGIQLPLLCKLGFEFTWNPKIVHNEIREIRNTFFPTMLGLMGTQVNVLLASVIAWAFSGPAHEAIWWLGRICFYPLRSGSTSAIYFSERLYEFPQGLLGIAIATVIYPMLSRHAARNDIKALGEELCFGLRIVLSLAIPSGVGLMLLADNFAHLFYQRGAFLPEDTYRTADMIFGFSFGVAGFCAIPLLARAFYAMGDIWTPCWVMLVSALLFLILGLSLIWTVSEQGLAYAASIAATFHATVLIVICNIRQKLIDYYKLLLAIGRSSIASLVMACVVLVILQEISGERSIYDIYRISCSTFFGAMTFGVIYFILGGQDIQKLLLKESTQSEDDKRKHKKK